MTCMIYFLILRMQSELFGFAEGIHAVAFKVGVCAGGGGRRKVHLILNKDKEHARVLSGWLQRMENACRQIHFVFRKKYFSILSWLSHSIHGRMHAHTQRLIDLQTGVRSQWGWRRGGAVAASQVIWAGSWRWWQRERGIELLSERPRDGQTDKKER